MREKDFEIFLENEPSISSHKAVLSRLVKARKAEKILGKSLDVIVSDDNTMLDALNKLKQFENPMHNSLQNAVRKYYKFANNKNFASGVAKSKSTTVAKNKPYAVKDSYQEFLDFFGISKDDLYKWGINSTIFPSFPEVDDAWEDLKDRIFNDKVVYIRGYGRDAHATQLYKDLYMYLFNNHNIEKDSTNNALPHRHIQKLTGLRRNKDIYNYQVSHIWGHTKNVFLFEAPWNICYTPKIIDPFTGHETRGVWPAEFQKLFVSHARKMYKKYIDEYNQLLIDYDVENKLNAYLNTLKGTISEKEFARFEKDVRSELSPIV